MFIEKKKAGDTSIRASDWNTIAEFVNGSLNTNAPGLKGYFNPTVLIQNDTGSDLEQFAAVGLDVPLNAIEEDGSVDLIFDAATPAVDKTLAIIAEPIESVSGDPVCGRAIIYGLAWATVHSATGVQSSWRHAEIDPDTDLLTASESGRVLLLDAPAAEGESKLVPVLVNAGGSGGGTSIYTYELTSDFSTNADGDNEATADIFNLAGDLVEEDAVIIDRSEFLYVDDQATGDVGHCAKEGDIYTPIQAPCSGSGGGSGSGGLVGSPGIVS